MVSAFSVPKAKREHKYNDVPGPGQYNPENLPKIVKQSDPKYSFGKDGRKQVQTYVPGPGAYELKQHYTIDKKPSYTILARRQLKQHTIDVGPGQYEPKYGFGKDKSPAYSMKGRSFSTLQSKPGPGQYQSPETLQKNLGKSFGRDGRDKDSPSKIPGPGSYDYENAVFKYGSKNQPKYGFGSRIQLKNHNNVPGPGQYDGTKGGFSKIGGIMARDMHSSLILSKTPGPGSYDQSSFGKVKGKDPQWSMSKSTRQNHDNGLNVGPGQYDHDSNFKNVITSSPKYRIGSDKRSYQYDNRVPGPGSYDQSLLKSRMSIKIGQKPKDLSQSYVPGPGTYDHDQMVNQSWLKGQGRYSIGKSARDLNIKSQIPGPGTYDNLYGLKNPNGKITFGKDPRDKNNQNGNPGPGHYSLKPHFADVPKYLLPDKN